MTCAPWSASSARDSVSTVQPSRKSPTTCAKAAASASALPCCCLPRKSHGYRGRGIVRLGAVVEMVHTATLVHDDIIDAPTPAADAPLPTPPGATPSCVLAGDWLYMQAFRVALDERNFKVLDLLIGLTQQMVEGELLQTETLGTHGLRRRVLRPHLPQDRVPL